MCDAVCGRADSQALLERIERANLFLVPLDAVRGWWRYHQLFAELLRARLAQARPERVPELHQAAAWCEQHGLADDAIGHALAAGDAVWAARLLERHFDAVLRRSEGATLRRWLAGLLAELVRSRPRLCVAQALWALIGGRLESQVQRAQGRLSAALRTYQQALELAGEAGRLPPAGMAHVGMAGVLYERGALDPALGHATLGIALCRQLAYPLPLLAGLATLARIRQAQGDQSGALEAIAEAERVELSPAVERLHALAAAQGRRGSVIEVQALQALALAAAGDEPEGLATLAGALALGAPEGYVRVFVDEGAPRGGAARQAHDGRAGAGRGRRRRPARLPRPAHRRVRAGRPGRPPQPGRGAVLPGLVVPLSARELEVLGLLAAGKPNQAIAAELVITLDTVKRHVTHILDKLGAANRTQAVTQARELGLLR